MDDEEFDMVLFSFLKFQKKVPKTWKKKKKKSKGFG